jgi:hypothetical protein
MKAAEFARLAEAARDREIADELRALAARYLARALDLERASATPRTAETE